ncbi:hypothetical protein KLP40_18420 [Hymenobacter sp. NST-14]|uniref:hypothetical protein n=1 Tax=Hymenobacter piscis TaxID=2839984 RepID=UPI001C029223|nr:hypothetical protein [Hymenobacter piscis]MBT9395149.1 hypothetical protein [Hymenobacter piscis]
MFAASSATFAAPVATVAPASTVATAPTKKTITVASQQEADALISTLTANQSNYSIKTVIVIIFDDGTVVIIIIQN